MENMEHHPPSQCLGQIREGVRRPRTDRGLTRKKSAAVDVWLASSNPE